MMLMKTNWIYAVDVDVDDDYDDALTTYNQTCLNQI